MDVPSYITVGGWFIQVIFDKYLSSQLQTWATNSGIGEDLDKLRIAMLRVQSVLSCAEKTRSEGILGWMKELRDVSYDAEDLLDELEYCRLQQQLDAESSSPVSAFLTSNLEAARDVAARAGGFLSSSFFNITERSNALNQAAASLPTRLSNSRLPGTPEMTWDRVTKARIRTVIERLNHVSSCVSETITLFKLDHYNGLYKRTKEGTTSSLITTKVFGREDEVKKLIHLLLRSNNKQDFVLSLVGIGGVGKTTLAQIVYNDPKIVEHFELRMWVCVSDSFDDAELMREILECASDVNHEYEGIMNFNRLQVAIKEKLMSKRFLLVLDDVWNQENSSRLSEMERWNKLLAPLQAGKSGSKVLVTTRSRTVSEMLSTTNSIDLKGLKDQDCWSLIKECTYCDVNPVEQLKLENVGNKIAQTLRGLPLAAKAAAGLLKNKLDAKDWNVVLERNDIWDGIVPVLQPSYNNLPAHLQRCFAYCSIFPKGWNFESDDLIYLWMAQGYIQPQNKNVRMEDTGRDYLDDLLSRSFIEVQRKGVITHYIVDNSLHDLAQYVSRDECIRVEDDEATNNPPFIRHLSIKTEKLANIKHVYPFHNLRSLIAFSKIQYNLHNALLEDALKDLKHVRVLDLSHCRLDNLPGVISHCIHLRYLNL